MAPKKNQGYERNVEECVKRVLQESLQEPAILNSLATLIKDVVVAELKSALDKNSEVIQKLEYALQERDRKIVELEKQLSSKQDDLEQYQRRQCLRIFGVPEDRGEDTDVIAIDVAKKIGVDLTIEDIDRSHRVGKVSDGDKIRPVIVKFVSYRKRCEMFRNKRLLKGSNVTIREDLTKKRHDMLRQCITKYGLKNVWTLDGAIFVREGDNKRRITKQEDIV